MNSGRERSSRPRPSWKLRDLSFGIEVFRHPAEFVPRLRAAQPLVERKAPCPSAEFGRYCLRGNDFRHLTPRAEALRKRARRRPRDGAAPLATPTFLPAPKPWPASPASARNTCSRRCTITNQACDPAAAWRRRRMSPIPSAKRKSKRWRISDPWSSRTSRNFWRSCESRDPYAVLYRFGRLGRGPSTMKAGGYGSLLSH